MCGGGGGLLSLATGGLSDIVQDRPMGSGTADLINGVFPEYTFAGQVVPSLFDPVGAGNRDIGRIWDKGGSAIDVFSNTFDRMADPTNSVNYSLERFGEQLPENIRQYAPTLGATIGTAIYPVGGTALGYGIGAHLAGQNSTQALTGAGISATAAYAGQAASGLMSGAPTAAEAAAKAADPELAYILADMGNSTQSGYAGTLGAAGGSTGAAAGTPLVYGSPQFYEAAGQIGMTPAEAMKIPVDWLDLAKDVAVKVGPKLLSSAFSGGEAPTANLMSNANAIKLPDYQQTNNTWSSPEMASLQLADQQLEQQRIEKLKKQQEEEEDKRQAYLKDYIADIPAKSDYLSDYLG